MTVLLAVAITLSGCSSLQGGSSGSSALKVGVIAPLTGDVKTFGESTKNGVALAVEEAKAKGMNIEVIYQDDKNDPTEGVNAANKLISQDGVNAIVGSVSSKVSIPISEVAQSNKIFMITGTSTSTKVTVDNGQRKDYVFRACFIDPFQGTVMAKFALENLKAKKAAVLYDVSNDYTKGLAEYFKAGFEQGGGQVAVFESYGKDDTDFSALLTKVATAQPDFLFLPDYYNKVSLIAKQAREKGITAVFGGGDGWDSAELDYQATAGGYFSNHYSPDDTRPEVQAFVKAYKDKYGSVPDALATLGYDAATLLFTAYEKAGSNDPAKIKDAMAGLQGIKTVSGAITFDKNGDPVKSAAILQIKDGKQVFVTSVAP
ncbi:MAG: ABC transporter substrate-binding protein [Chloroflexota bacterium]